MYRSDIERVVSLLSLAEASYFNFGLEPGGKLFYAVEGNADALRKKLAELVPQIHKISELTLSDRKLVVEGVLRPAETAIIL